MFLDIIPGSSGKKHVSRSLVQKIKDGGKIADDIREMSDRQHAENDVPRAERHLEDSLGKWPEQVSDNKYQTSEKNNKKTEMQKKSRLQTWLQKIKDFLWTEL